MSSEHHQAGSLLYAGLAILGLILMLVWMQGGFAAKVAPGNVRAAEAEALPPGHAVAVTEAQIAEQRRWPATVSARTVSRLAPKVAARIAEITVKAGDAVRRGQVLVRLDPRETSAQVGQARAALAAAEAQAGQAGADARRMQNLFQKEAATRQTLDAAQAAAHSAQARVAEARAAIAAAESLAGETSLQAPFDGVVTRRDREPGDMAMPGTAVLTMQSTQRARVEAAIPESCSQRISQGERMTARIGEESVPVRVEEIAPSADPATRTVLIKAGLEAERSTPAGAFAELEQACGEHSALLVPLAAVSRTGQLESVRVLRDGKPMLRHVRTGRSRDGLIEILSGLNPGEQVWVGGRP